MGPQEVVERGSSLTFTRVSGSCLCSRSCESGDPLLTVLLSSDLLTVLCDLWPLLLLQVLSCSSSGPGLFFLLFFSSFFLLLSSLLGVDSNPSARHQCNVRAGSS